MPLPVWTCEETMSKTVVIGASSGLGRCIGVGLAERGDQVALLARRRRADRERGARRPDRARSRSNAMSPTRRRCVRPSAPRRKHSAVSTTSSTRRRSDRSCALVDTDADTWGRVFATNVTGAAVATAAAVPHLTESAGKVVYFSSDAGTYGPPWPGLAAYGVSKAALEGSSRHGAPSIRTSDSPTSSSANAQAATVTQPRDSTSAGTWSSPWSTTRSGFRVGACPAS